MPLGCQALRGPTAEPARSHCRYTNLQVPGAGCKHCITLAEQAVRIASTAMTLLNMHEKVGIVQTARIMLNMLHASIGTIVSIILLNGLPACKWLMLHIFCLRS